jgi:hypothetical protein
MDKVKLSIRARIKLNELLADQVGSFAKMKVIRKAMEELSLSEEEIKLVDYREEIKNNQTVSQWNSEKDPMKECEINMVILETLVSKLKKLDDSGSLKRDQIELYEQFVEGYNQLASMDK